MENNSRKERWKEFKLDYKSKFRYAISSYGRLKSFEKNIDKGTVLNGSSVDGYKVFKYKIHKKNTVIYKHLFFHKLVATAFSPTRSKEKTFVLHLDHDRQNNRLSNLKWATHEHMVEHSKTSPRVISALKKLVKFNQQRNGHKLTVAEARTIKKQVTNPKRKTGLQQIAEKYGVSLMALHRIRTGENWGHLKV